MLSGGDTEAVWFAFTLPLAAGEPTLPTEDSGSTIGMGAAIAAAIERDSRLDAASECYKNRCWLVSDLRLL